PYMDIFNALILGIVQGITEFLPISSSGHLVLVREFLVVDEINQLAFDAILHLATTAAVIIYFWSDIWNLVQTAIRKLGRLPVNEKDLTLLYALAAGTAPAVFFGLVLDTFISTYLYSLLTVAIVLALASCFFIYAEWRYYQKPPQGALTVRRGLAVGFFQVLALLPGFSRSGATLAGGMLLGLTRYEAAKFSFLMAIPITLGVGLKKLLELILLEGTIAWGPIMVGIIVSFVMALLVIHFFLGFIRRYTLWPFIWYGLVLSFTVIYIALYV
ncbi:MAG TPA: undecaprenyl-diphosphatase UppP, partial [Candidatus Paceibacterota bacterium]|nr:undecaprenyl-diphosphatase UppP [Candidatus Paceibacterota bacterium]